jgi:hypothetical protein
VGSDRPERGDRSALGWDGRRVRRVRAGLIRGRRAACALAVASSSSRSRC